MTLFADRRERLWSQVHGEGIDALLITNPLNVTYLTGFSGEATFLIASAEKMLLVSDGRFVEQLKEECPDMDAHIRPPGQTLHEAAGLVLSKFNARSVGYESNHLTVAEFETIRERVAGLDWKPGPSRVETLRMVKDAFELGQIREAIEIAEKAFKAFRSGLLPEHTEKQMHDAMEHLVRRCGGKCTAFPTIAAVGARAALPHAPPGQAKLADAPFLLLDWGANGPFYKSDLTRVLWTRKPSESSGTDPLRAKLVEVHGVVMAARRAALELMRPGVELQAIDTAARGVIHAAGYGEYFNHGLGHGFGLQIHEAPFMRPGNPMKLEAGMVVTLEPGIYLPGMLGVRIEDDILITPDGPELLTHLPRGLDGDE